MANSALGGGRHRKRDDIADAPSDFAGSYPQAHFDVRGGRASMARAADGTVTVSIIGSDGTHHGYTVGLESGVPVVTPEVVLPAPLWTELPQLESHLLATLPATAAVKFEQQDDGNVDIRIEL